MTERETKLEAALRSLSLRLLWRWYQPNKRTRSRSCVTV